MEVYVKNEEKPKDCWDCFNFNCDHWGTHGYDYAETDCPLIEIDEPKVGKWETKVASNGWNDWYVFECPLCGARIEDKDYHEWDYNYCPNCGAKMER